MVGEQDAVGRRIDERWHMIVYLVIINYRYAEMTRANGASAIRTRGRIRLGNDHFQWGADAIADFPSGIRSLIFSLSTSDYLIFNDISLSWTVFAFTLSACGRYWHSPAERGGRLSASWSPGNCRSHGPPLLPISFSERVACVSMTSLICQQLYLPSCRDSFIGIGKACELRGCISADIRATALAERRWQSSSQQ